MVDRLARCRGRLGTSPRARHCWPRRSALDLDRPTGYNRAARRATRTGRLRELNLDDSSQTVTRRWTVIASGLLLSAMALVVIYTGRAAFHSWLAVVVVAAIGMAALLLQLRLQRESPRRVRTPIWLNSIGVLCSLLTIAADWLHLGLAALQIVALAAVGCFAVSGFVILAGLRRNRA